MMKILLPVLVVMSILFSGCSFERSVRKDVQLEGENIGGMKESEILKKLDRYEQKIFDPPKDARLNEKWEVIESEHVGKKLNTKLTLQEIINSPEGKRVNIIVEELRPGITAEHLKSNIIEIGSFTTPLLDRQEARINNIELASEKINYKVLAPGEEFSFNGVVGKRTVSKGYEEAPIIIRAEDGYKKGFGVGGGICQLASTIYSCAVKSGLEITEHHMHSKDVGYIPRGQDAAVSYGTVDLKFKNSRSFPVMIRVWRDSKNLTVKMFENRNNI
ncbi:MAG: VanW family protein [Clostridia bacterium]|nr:VanW family protein [Clostridia bacterium]